MAGPFRSRNRYPEALQRSERLFTQLEFWRRDCAHAADRPSGESRHRSVSGRSTIFTVFEPGNTGYQTRTRSEEHTSELQSLMRISYAVFCLKKKKNEYNTHN